jgi:indole-3-glycerol phosphate synthase
VTILETIVSEKRGEIADWPERGVTVADVRAAIAARGGLRDFLGALRSCRRSEMGLIAEVKKASPSAGVIRSPFDPVAIAKEYERAGATCLSVLTDEKFFQGSLEYLRAIRQAVGLPLLRKDFVIDERQVLEAVEWGADAILLIAAILTDDVLEGLHALGRGSGLAVLVEVHDEPELERALRVGADLIGVNNRDLRTFQVDLGTTERLAARLPARFRDGGGLLVAESGIRTRADVERLARCGAGAILVGESLMREADLGAKVRELRGEGNA